MDNYKLLLNGEWLDSEKKLTVTNPADGRAFAEVATRYTYHMRDEMARSENARLMPGVIPLMEMLGRRADVRLGLLTGNFEATARIKLDRFDLNRFFPFGAFGSDDGVRTRLVPIAVERAEAYSGGEIGLGPQVVVIGDTPQDVECALVNGATAIGVAASRYSVEDLIAAGAHHAMDDVELDLAELDRDVSKTTPVRD